MRRAGGRQSVVPRTIAPRRRGPDRRTPPCVDTKRCARPDRSSICPGSTRYPDSLGSRPAVQSGSSQGIRPRNRNIPAILWCAAFSCGRRGTGSRSLMRWCAKASDGSLTHARRRELHRAAAAIFADDPVLRAEHLDRAGDSETAHAYFVASEAQASLFRQDQAVTLAVRGLAVATDKRDSFDLGQFARRPASGCGTR